jgi:ubiquinol-cytochrome c reductase cytochrome b subunit
LTVQIITGLLLTLHYAPHISLAFDLMEHIMRDVNYGWLFRFAHSNGASFFFIVVYIHMARAFYYFSFALPRHPL